jgi:hypothetical protein
VGTERLAEAEARSRTTDTAVLVAAVISGCCRSRSRTSASTAPPCPKRPARRAAGSPRSPPPTARASAPARRPGLGAGLSIIAETTNDFAIREHQPRGIELWMRFDLR